MLEVAYLDLTLSLEVRGKDTFLEVSLAHIFQLYFHLRSTLAGQIPPGPLALQLFLVNAKWAHWNE